MPFISLQLSTDITAEQSESLAKGITQIMSDLLGKDRSLTSVSISKPEAAHWYIADRPLNPINEKTAFLSARISAGSNSNREKSAAISALYTLLNHELGPISSISYIVIDEVPVSDWGYGGKTQQERNIRRRADGSIDTQHYLQQGLQQRTTAMQHWLNRFINLFKTKKTGH